MKILQVIPVFTNYYGGPISVVKWISKELAKKHDVTIFTTSAVNHKTDFSNYPVEKNIDNYKVIYFPRIMKVSNLHISIPMERMLKNVITDYDIIHLHSWRNFQDIIVGYYANKYKVPYILHPHGPLQSGLNMRRIKIFYDYTLGHKLIANASKIIALTQMEKEQFMLMSINNEKIEVIPNGIHLSEYTNLTPKGQFKKTFNIPGENKIILYLGRLNRYKGIEFLINSYNYLIKDRKYNNITLVIAGPDDGYLYEIKKLIASLEISDKVILTGMLSEKEKIDAFTDSTICAYLSPYEPFGIVSLEAMVCGIPVIVSTGTPMSNIMKNENLDYSVKYGDIIKLAEILSMVKSNEKLLIENGEKGRKFVSENYDWAKIVFKFEAVYEEVIKDYRKT